MNLIRTTACAVLVSCINLNAIGQTAPIVLSANDAGPLVVGAQAYEKYITRSSFSTLTLDDLVFSESIPGKLLVDLAVTYYSDTSQVDRMQILFEDLIEASRPGEPLKLTLSGQALGRPVSLARVTSIEVAVRATPVASGKYEAGYALLKPILGKALYGVDIGGVIDAFSSIASADTAKPKLVFKATIPVPQNVVEAERLDRIKDSKTPPLHNNVPIAISLSGSKEVIDPSVLGKAQTFLNGVTRFVVGRDVVSRNINSFSGAMSLRFNKDATQALSQTVVTELETLSQSAHDASSSDDLKRLQSKIESSIRVVDAAKQGDRIDARSHFHLRQYIELARCWAMFRTSSIAGQAALRSDTGMQQRFRDWFDTMKIQGVAQLTQAYFVSEVYRGRVARVFIPYSLTDEMTLEVIQRQLSIHQSLAGLSNVVLSEPLPPPSQ